MADTFKATSVQLNHGQNTIDNLITEPVQATLFRNTFTRVPNNAHHVSITQFTDKADFGRTATCTLGTFGDLLSNLLLYVRLPPLPTATGSTYTGYVQSTGYALIKSLDFLVGGTTVARLDGRAMDALDYLSSGTTASSMMVGTYDTYRVLAENAYEPQDLYIPIPLWFTKKIANAFPLCLFTNYTVQVRVHFRDFQQMVHYDGPNEPTEMSIMDAGIVAEYILMTDKEREALKAKKSHEFLIEQYTTENIKSITQGNLSIKCNLQLRNPIKELIWFLTEEESEQNNDWFNYGLRDEHYEGNSLMTAASLYLDSALRYGRLPESYYRLVSPSRFHKHPNMKHNRNIYSISFSQSPESLQPSGYLNASRYDSIDLHVELISGCPASKIYTVAVGYNIMTLDDGVVTMKGV